MKKEHAFVGWIKEYLSYSQNVVALFTTIFAALVICFVLLSSPRPGMMDFGQYDYILSDLGLVRTEETLSQPDEIYFMKLIEEYDIEGLSMERLFASTQTESIVFPVVLICLICNLFNAPFSTIYLALLYIVVILISTYFLFKSLYTLLGSKTAVISVLYIFCVLCGANLVPLNSLYSEGMILVSFILFISMVCRCISNGEGRGMTNIVPMLIGAFLLLTAGESTPYMIIPVAPVAIYCIWLNRPIDEKKRVYYAVTGIILIFVVLLCGSHINSMAPEKTKERLYSATFDGAFLYAENPEEALSYFGIDHQFMDDIGKGYYLSQEEYVLAPYLEEADDVLFNKITYGKLLRYYISHPQTFLNLMDNALKETGQVNREKYIYLGDKNIDGQKEQVERFDFWQLIRPFIFCFGIVGMIIYFSIILVLMLLLVLYFNKRERKLSCRVCYLYLFLNAFCMWNLIINLFLYGNWDIKTRLFTYMISQDVLFVCTFGFMAFSLRLLSEKMGLSGDERETETADVGSVVYEAYHVMKSTIRQRIGNALRKSTQWFNHTVLNSRKYTTILLGGLATVIMVWVLFFPDRIGAYNNGDFGRMMDAMGIYFTEYDLIHQDEQYVTKVVEVYDWLDNFDWATVTPISPTMSQVFISLIVKLTAGAAGLQFSTIYATIIYVILMSISFCAIVWGLYKLVGKKSILLDGLLIVILFGSYNLGWFNSLFSEATEMAGFLMVLGSSIYMIAKDRGTCNWKNWLVFLISIRFFIGAKSQVTIEVAFLVIWAMFLAIYHRKEKIFKWIMQMLLICVACVFLCRSAVIIFQKDSAISSQDTIYSSIFSGVLLVADDQEQALQELGLDTRLVADAGKSTYADKSEFFCAPRTEKAEEMIYSKVNTFKVLSWYLKHPDKLWIMMNQAAKESAATMPDYFLYVGEKTTLPHRTVSKFNIWSAIRANVTPKTFVGYILFYGILLGLCVIQIFSKKSDTKRKLMAGLYILIMCMGVAQFPLSVIGNGFTDNIKQLYAFRLIHDVVFAIAVFWLICWIINKVRPSDTIEMGEREDILKDEL